MERNREATRAKSTLRFDGVTDMPINRQVLIDPNAVTDNKLVESHIEGFTWLFRCGYTTFIDNHDIVNWCYKFYPEADEQRPNIRLASLAPRIIDGLVSRGCSVVYGEEMDEYFPEMQQFALFAPEDVQVWHRKRREIIWNFENLRMETLRLQQAEGLGDRVCTFIYEQARAFKNEEREITWLTNITPYMLSAMKPKDPYDDPWKRQLDSLLRRHLDKTAKAVAEFDDRQNLSRRIKKAFRHQLAVWRMAHQKHTRCYFGYEMTDEELPQELQSLIPPAPEM